MPQGRDGKALSLLCSVAPDIHVVGARFLHAQNTDGAAAQRRAEVAPPKPAGELVASAPGRERYQALFHG